MKRKPHSIAQNSSLTHQQLLDLYNSQKQVKAERAKERAKKADGPEYLGMHNGTVRGKYFERSRRARKSHVDRKAEVVARSLANLNGQGRY